MTDSLEHLRPRLKAFARERDWKQFHTPKNLSMALIAEAAELVEHFLWLSPEQRMAIAPNKLEEVRPELADTHPHRRSPRRRLGGGRQRQDRHQRASLPSG